MRNALILIAFAFFTSSGELNAEEFKKIHDNISGKVVEICSTNSDGSVIVAGRCKYNLVDLPFLARLADPKTTRKSEELTEITSKISTFRDENSTFAVFNHALVEIIYDMANGKSNILVYRPSEDSLSRYKSGTGWIVETKDLSMEVSDVDGFKVGDKLCLSKPPQGYPKNLLVKIKRLFANEHYAVVDTVSDGFLGMGNTFRNHYTSFNNLKACDEEVKSQLSLDPKQIIKTSAPQVPEDIRVNSQQLPKEQTPAESEATSGASSVGNSISK